MRQIFEFLEPRIIIIINNNNFHHHHHLFIGVVVVVVVVEMVLELTKLDFFVVFNFSFSEKRMKEGHFQH